MRENGRDVEDRYLDILAMVVDTVDIPVAVKLSPFFSSLASFARQLDGAGTAALVFFNRFYQPDIDLEELEVYPHVLLSTPQSMRLPLRWIAILHRQIYADLAAYSGVHTAADMLKMLMVGADVTMMTSALLKYGIDYARIVLRDLAEWLEEHEYESVEQMKGSMSHRNCANPAAFERANCMKALSTYR